GCQGVRGNTGLKQAIAKALRAPPAQLRENELLIATAPSATAVLQRGAHSSSGGQRSQACAASGHAAAAPPSSVMNLRRFIAAIIQSPRRRARAALAEYRGPALSQYQC